MRPACSGTTIHLGITHDPALLAGLRGQLVVQADGTAIVTFTLPDERRARAVYLALHGPEPHARPEQPVRHLRLVE